MAEIKRNLRFTDFVFLMTKSMANPVMVNKPPATTKSKTDHCTSLEICIPMKGISNKREMMERMIKGRLRVNMISIIGTTKISNLQGFN